MSWLAILMFCFLYWLALPLCMMVCGLVAFAIIGFLNTIMLLYKAKSASVKS